MQNITRYTPASVNLTGLGILYVLAAALQTWYWGEHLFARHMDLVEGLFQLIASGPLQGKVFGIFLVALFVATAYIILHLFYIGYRLIRLSWSSNARILQTRKDRWEMAKTAAFLLVAVLVFLVFVPLMQPPSIELEMLGTLISGVMMAGYSLFAVAKYKGER